MYWYWHRLRARARTLCVPDPGSTHRPCVQKVVLPTQTSLKNHPTSLHVIKKQICENVLSTGKASLNHSRPWPLNVDCVPGSLLRSAFYQEPLTHSARQRLQSPPGEQRSVSNMSLVKAIRWTQEDKASYLGPRDWALTNEAAVSMDTNSTSAKILVYSPWVWQLRRRLDTTIGLLPTRTGF